MLDHLFTARNKYYQAVMKIVLPIKMKPKQLCNMVNIDNCKL